MKSVLAALVFLVIGAAFAAPMEKDDPELRELMHELELLKEEREADAGYGASEEAPQPYEREQDEDFNDGYNEDFEAREQEDFGQNNNFDDDQEDLWEREMEDQADLPEDVDAYGDDVLERGENEMDEGVLPSDEGFYAEPVEDDNLEGNIDERGAEEAAGLTEDEADELAKEILESASNNGGSFEERAIHAYKSTESTLCTDAMSVAKGMIKLACPKYKKRPPLFMTKTKASPPTSKTGK